MNTDPPSSLDVTPPRSRYDDTIVNAVRTRVPHVLAVYRYGSAGGAFERADSDIDIAIRTPDGLPLESRIALAGELMDTFHRQVDVVDMAEIPVTLRVQIAAHGARLYCVNPGDSAEYESRAFSDYARLNEERRAILEDIRQRGHIHG